MSLQDIQPGEVYLYNGKMVEAIRIDLFEVIVETESGKPLRVKPETLSLI